jgi:Domain of unknown function (DUF4062)
VKVFISSVRRGLEGERDALPGLVLGLGHEPTRFEDFGSLPVPSREACLRGVENADAYLLLLGEHYGDPLPDTGKSPTEEEWNVAKRRGIPILVFRKQGITPELAQAEFIRRVEDYVEGRFRGSFGSVGELLATAGKAIRALDVRPAALVWKPLPAVTVPWHPFPRGASGGTSGTVLEVHVLSAKGQTILTTVLANLGKRLARAGRDAGVFAEEQALSMSVDEDGATVATRATDQREPATGIRADRDGTVSMWSQLPSDFLGALLDEADLRERIASALRLIADLGLAKGDVAVAVGLHGLSMVSIGDIGELGRRTSGTVGLPGGPDVALVEPTHAVPATALGPAAGEIAGELAARLLLRFRALAR